MIKKLKIGILLNDDLKLQDGHIKIVNQILKSNFINLNQIFTYNKLPKINLITNFLYKFISYTEKKYNRITRVKEEKKLKKILLNKNNINLLSINKDLKKKIKKLDLLISFENNRFIQSKIFTKPKYGCWLINHGISNNIFTGFWECFLGLLGGVLQEWLGGVLCECFRSAFTDLSSLKY